MLRQPRRRAAAIVAVVAVSVLSATNVASAQDPVTDGLVLWLKADAGVIENDFGVATWEDQSGLGNHATAANFGEPEFVPVEPGLGDMPTLFFDGALALMTVENRLLADDQEELTVFAVAQPGSDSAASIFSIREGNSLMQLDQQGGAAPNLGRSRMIVRNSGGTTANSLGEIGTLQYGIFAGTLTASGTQRTALVNYNGVNGEPATADFGDDTTFTVGEQQVGGVNCCGQLRWNGEIAEILLYDRVLSFDEMNTVGVYLEDKYALVTAWPMDPLPPERTWNVDFSGDWNAAGNWDPIEVPNGNDKIAVFGAAITVPRVVFTETAVTAKSIVFNHDVSYTIAGATGASVNLEADAGNATLDVLLGSHQFQAVVNLVSNTDAMASGGAQIDFNNALNLGGNTLAISGDGQININNAVTAGGGSVVNSGNLGGSGAIGGSLTNAAGGTVGPGNSPGTLTVMGDFVQQAGGTLAIELAGTDEGQYDVLTVDGAATLEGGNLDISLVGFTPSNGDTFDVMTATSIDDQGLSLTGDSSGFSYSVVGGGVLDADFDFDGDVDGNDFLTWQNAGADSDDLLAWQSEFGSIGGGGGDGQILRLTYDGFAASSAVPEPGTLLLMVAALLATGLCRVSRRVG